MSVVVDTADSLHGQSIKTRVEASSTVCDVSMSKVYTDNPLKQGLKLLADACVDALYKVYTDNPLKQGLKLSDVDRKSPGAEVYTDNPLKQGLKPVYHVVVLLAARRLHGQSIKTRVEARTR